MPLVCLTVSANWATAWRSCVVYCVFLLGMDLFCHQYPMSPAAMCVYVASPHSSRGHGCPWVGVLHKVDRSSEVESSIKPYASLSFSWSWAIINVQSLVCIVTWSAFFCMVVCSFLIWWGFSQEALGWWAPDWPGGFSWSRYWLRTYHCTHAFSLSLSPSLSLKVHVTCNWFYGVQYAEEFLCWPSRRFRVNCFRKLKGLLFSVSTFGSCKKDLWSTKWCPKCLSRSTCSHILTSI
jgi:hypothetical protein